MLTLLEGSFGVQRSDGPRRVARDRPTMLGGIEMSGHSSTADLSLPDSAAGGAVLLGPTISDGFGPADLPGVPDLAHPGPGSPRRCPARKQTTEASLSVGCYD